MSAEAPTIAVRRAHSLDDGLLDGILSGEIGGVLARGVASPAQCDALIAHLKSSDLQALDAAPFPGITYGAVLVVSDPDLVRYRREGARLDDTLAADPVPAAMRDALGRIAAPGTVGVPEGFHDCTTGPGESVFLPAGWYAGVAVSVWCARSGVLGVCCCVRTYMYG